jgi:hypothetical protein
VAPPPWCVGRWRHAFCPRPAHRTRTSPPRPRRAPYTFQWQVVPCTHCVGVPVLTNRLRQGRARHGGSVIRAGSRVRVGSVASSGPGPSGPVPPVAAVVSVGPARGAVRPPTARRRRSGRAGNARAPPCAVASGPGPRFARPRSNPPLWPGPVPQPGSRPCLTRT